ncbi:LolA-like putative outer membrane lipoprotein chaperone [Prevotella sp. AGR2160]|uniref:LolA-like putative outer membrane lipoprotein chaperone n=1 Tax=Prevotella sp. AGR2160 TaxID=1280674 RepID=UPI0004143969|nr:LolA-like putative outer membrane lipoprotein chaperone [Prevotella sp. AGR2160]
MKRLFLSLLLMLTLTITMSAQTATQVLNKTAAVIGRKGGARANFSISSKSFGSTSGTIAIKGQKFYAHTPVATVWFNGKTQWSYMKRTQEVNVSNPTQAQQMAMNPYTFIHIYKTGYKTSMKRQGGNFVVHLVAANQKRTVQEMYITINSRTYVPSVVKMRQGRNWSTIRVSGFQAKNQPDGLFTFRAKDYPQAEVIDLR